jgi:hypothetical protein
MSPQRQKEKALGTAEAKFISTFSGQRWLVEYWRFAPAPEPKLNRIQGLVTRPHRTQPMFGIAAFAPTAVKCH